MLNSGYVDQLVYRGTTTVGLVCADGVVLATDTRVTMPRSFIAHRKGKKVHKIDDHLGITISGVVADAQNVVDTLRYHAGIYKLEKRDVIPVRAIARMASNVFFSSRLFPYIADVLIGGYDKMGPSIFNVDFFGSITKENYVSTGSGSPIAYGILESEYREGLTIEDGMAIAVKAVTSAMKRDAMSGDSFDVVKIDKDGYLEISEEEKKRVLTKVLG
ncbi:MAG: archaeal proteasome endopeptidase complex subunit beta [Nitrososphaerales archaeon]|nr:archaeal proteasome endopeptidase complex subunit beta [Nitrososphaerales archaeon]